jgi:hypothetical protein
MISYHRLPGRLNQQALNGVSDWFGMPSFVKDYWNVVKQNIQNIKDTGPKITAYWARISYAQQKLIARGDTVGANALADEMSKIADDMQKWSKVKQAIDDYLPSWAQLDDPGSTAVTPSSGVSGLGFVPLILSAVAIAALAYVVNTGMALYQDYQFKSQLTQAVIDQKISSGQMKDILSVPREEGLLERTVDIVGVTGAVGIPTVLLIGGGLYILFTTGMLNKILGSVGSMIGGSSSTPASGG